MLPNMNIIRHDTSTKENPEAKVVATEATKDKLEKSMFFFVEFSRRTLLVNGKFPDAAMPCKNLQAPK